jgi:hypothetical protein
MVVKGSIRRFTEIELSDILVGCILKFKTTKKGKNEGGKNRANA